MTDFIPEDAMYAVAEMKQVSRNTFKLETSSATTAGPNRQVTVNLPENAILDMKSFRFFFRATCVGSTENAAVVRAKLPGHASSMLQRVSVFINGQQVQQGSAEYHTIAQALRLTGSNIDHDNSIGRLCSHAWIDDDDAADDDEQIVVQDWCGFLNESSTRYLNTGLIGSIQVVLTFSGNDALVPLEVGNNVGDDLTADGKIAAARMTYSVSDMYFSIASVSLDPMYNEMLRERLQAGGLQVNYKEYYFYELGNITGGAGSVRAALSAQSIDALHGAWRDSNHTSVGIKGHALPNATGVSAYVSNQLRFRAYNNGVSKLPGAMRYNWSVNNVRYGQFQESLVDAACNAGYAADKVGVNDGHLITSRGSFEDGKYVNSLLLAMPCKKGVAVKAGYDARGLNSALVWEVLNATNPGAVAATGETGILSAFFVASTTATLNIALGRDLLVTF